ncbi:MAG: hypothetical protein AB1778_00180 [Candidatus Bipolaricaulota bacterium]
MTRVSRSIGLALAGLVALAGIVAAQTAEAPPPDGERGERPADIQLFGGGDYPGGYLKYTYRVGREGTTSASTTTTEIRPLEDGTYEIVSTSTERVPLDLVHIGFFGISLPRLGIRVAENASGTIDMSPLSYISASEIEPGREYLLPDGARFQAGDLGTIAGVDVVHGTYTHADYTNVEIDFSFAVDLEIRNLLPFPARMALRYTADSADQGTGIFRTFSLVELAEFVREP